MTEKIKNLVRVAVLSFIFSAAIGSALANWSPPAGTPPFNNIPPPINVGAATQEKAGNLFLGNWLIAKKAQTTSSTVSGDNGKVLTTKDYVDARLLACVTGSLYNSGSGMKKNITDQINTSGNTWSGVFSEDQYNGGEDEWGQSCKTGWARTGCNIMSFNYGDNTDADLVSRNNGCFSDDEEYDNFGTIYTTCCRIE